MFITVTGTPQRQLRRPACALYRVASSWTSPRPQCITPVQSGRASSQHELYSRTNKSLADMRHGAAAVPRRCVGWLQNNRHLCVCVRHTILYYWDTSTLNPRVASPEMNRQP
ncbi:unnamed protein product [Danaus chrysippus]|uniref:(African queen) hypothetical protein n=1 Tax=Danaus chrysippus TaxID=151541 RepID=A0A8J2QM94_9NEOP|nr:unnamed protein product [Danaus chrysippus]